MSLKQFADSLPDYAKDLRLNISSILSDQLLGDDRKYGLLLACAHGTGYKPIVEAAEAEVDGKLSAEVANAARAAAALMAMNNVYYRFRHMVGKPVYGEKPAGLRMNRLAQPATNRTDFELMALAVSALNGCEACVRAHEKTVTDAGLTADHVNDAVRIAATIYAAAVALEAGETELAPPPASEVMTV